MAVINKQLLQHLAGLARIELTAAESKRFLKDLEKILGHFEELMTLDTKKVEPVAGGTSLQNVFREDTVDFAHRSDAVSHEGRIMGAFPEEEKGYLKVPKVL